MGSKKRERCRVTGVKNDNGTVRCSLQTARGGSVNYENVRVKKQAPGFMIVPEEGWIVEVEEDHRGAKVITGIAAGPEVKNKNSVDHGFRLFPPEVDNEMFDIAKMKPGEMVFQVDRATGIVFRKNEEKESFDLELHAGGDVVVNAGGEFKKNTGVQPPAEENGLTKTKPQ